MPTEHVPPLHSLEYPESAPAPTPAERRRLLVLAGGIAGLAAAAVALFLRLRSLRREAIEGESCMRGSIDIHADPESVYGVIKQFQIYPALMSFVRSVEPSEEGHLHWTIEGPAGIRLGWEARLTDLTPLRSIAWESLPNPLVSHAGHFEIEEISPMVTRLHAELRFGAPLGKPQLYLARLLGMDPRERFQPDLERIKHRVESGAGALTSAPGIYGRGIRESTGDHSRGAPRRHTRPASRRSAGSEKS